MGRFRACFPRVGECGGEAPRGRSAPRRRGRVVALALLLAISTATACRPRTDATSGRSDESSRGQPAPSATAVPGGDAQAAQTAAALAGAPALRPRIVALGDSLTAGYGLPADEAYPALLQHRFDELGYDYEAVNMGVSGDTSAGGLSRIDWALDGDVRVLIVALGGNDALRGLSPADMARNIGAIIDRARNRGVSVLLCGMEAPPNFGASYTSEFRAAFASLAREKRVAFVPFLLEGVAGQPGLNQADGIHPNAEGARKVADTVWAGLQPLLDSMANR